MLEVLAEYYNKKEIDLSEARIVGLDEWVGMDENDEGRCQYFLNKEKAWVLLDEPSASLIKDQNI